MVCARWLAQVVGALLAVVLLTPAQILLPFPGADGPFMWALHEGDSLGFAHGIDFVYTYGPLGYLAFVMPIEGRGAGPYLAGGLYVAVATAAYGLWAAQTALRWSRPRGISVMVFAVLIAVPLVLSFRSSVATVAAVAWAADTLVRKEALGRPRALLGAALVAPLFLVKFDAIGAVAIGLFAIAARSLTDQRSWHGVRRVAEAAVVAVASLLAWWVAAGQSPSDLPTWIRTSLAVASGFGDNMFGDEPWRAKEQMAIVACLAIAAVMMVRRRDVSRLNRVAFLGVFVLVALFGNKSISHHLALFGAWSFPVLMSAVRPGDLLGVLKAALAVFVTLAVQGLPPVTTDLRDLYGDRFSAVRLVTDADYRIDQARLGRRDLAEYYALPPDVREAMSGPIHVQPWDAVLPYVVPGASWDPLPVIQDYVAYTSTLDELNRERIESEDRPETIAKLLDAAVAPRLARWEPPASSLAVVCWYDETLRWASWLVLEARDESRCGEPEPLGEPSSARLGERLDVPAPPGPGVVVMRVVGLRDSPAELLKGLIDRRSSVFLHAESAQGEPVAVRFLVGHAGSPHVMRDRGCGLELLEGALGPGDLRTFVLSDAKDSVVGSDDYVVSFEYVPMEC